MIIELPNFVQISKMPLTMCRILTLRFAECTPLIDVVSCINHFLTPSKCYGLISS